MGLHDLFKKDKEDPKLQQTVRQAPVVQTVKHQTHVTEETPVIDRHLHEKVVHKVDVPVREDKQLPTVVDDKRRH